jgi:hypothetical protein
MSFQNAIAVRQTPLWAAYAFSFINSSGTYVVTSSGLFFLTAHGYGFTDVQNYLLGVCLGLTYIAGAKAAVHARPVLARWIPGISHRGLLVLLMFTLAALCLLPMLAAPDAGPRAVWPVWTIVLLYSPLMGILWPIVETYLAGGRSDAQLRAVMGTWNVYWSAAGVLTTLIIAPLVKAAPAHAIALVAGAHMLAALLLPAFTPDPAPHIEGHHEPHPPVYEQLLVTFRMLLPMSYVIMAAIGPFLPYAARRLDLPDGWHAFLPAAWLAPRVVMFLIMQRWQKWHGRWALAVSSGVMLVASFALAIASTLTSTGIGLPLLLIGLAAFGISIAMIYSAALYYALEVGRSDVDAGGTHEALIGVGYTIGPLFGLCASAAAERSIITADAAQGWVLGGVFALALAVTVVVVRRVRRLQVGEHRA